jgi:hypothetical protein
VAVFAVVVFLTMLACRQVASFLVGQALLGDPLNASLSDAALYVTVAGMTA